jgi:phosphonate transport system substrate-binding protein
MKVAHITTLAALTLLPAACGGESNAGPIELLRLSGIPDSDKAELERRFAPVAAYLEKEIGIPVRYEHMTDYTGAVLALGNGKIDIAWLGGVTAVDAETATAGAVTLVAARDTDLRFKSYFIANADAIASGKVKSVDALEELLPMLEGLSFQFGSKRSTSGHIMPRYFLAEAGITPEEDFRGGPKYSLIGGHDTTLQAVSTGQVDVGVLNYTTWERASDEIKKKAPIIYTTPDYVDYCLVAHNRLGPELIAAIRDAFTGLDQNQPEHSAILEAFSAEKFVAADAEDWNGIRQVLQDPRLENVLR